MNKIKIIDLIEYSSLLLVCSFIIFHNIYLVLTGIIFSLTCINTNFLPTIISSFRKKKSTKEKIPLESLLINKKEDIESNKKDSSLKLAETVEQLGFIPSSKKNDDSFAA